MSKFCNNCGNMVEDQAVFCNNCGATFQEEAAFAPEEPAFAPMEAPVEAPAKKPLNKKLIGIIAGAAAAIVVVIVAILIFGKPDPFEEIAQLMEDSRAYSYTDEGWEYSCKVEDKEKIDKETLAEIKEYLADKDRNEPIEEKRISEAYRVWYRIDAKCKDDVSHGITEQMFIKIDGKWYTFSYDYVENEKGKEEIRVNL